MTWFDPEPCKTEPKAQNQEQAKTKDTNQSSIDPSAKTQLGRRVGKGTSAPLGLPPGPHTQHKLPAQPANRAAKRHYGCKAPSAGHCHCESGIAGLASTKGGGGGGVVAESRVQSRRQSWGEGGQSAPCQEKEARVHGFGISSTP